MAYIPICWPEIQDYMDMPGFEENAYLINDDRGMEDFGSSAYFIDEVWYKDANVILEAQAPRKTKFVIRAEVTIEHKGDWSPDDVNNFVTEDLVLNLYSDNTSAEVTDVELISYE